MKKKITALLLMLCLLLGGCSLPEPPETAADGTPWSDEWTTLGAVLGVENVEGWKQQRNEDVLAAEGMYFASWIWGEAERNAEGESVYPAQVFLVLSECETEQEAEALAAQWQELVEENYAAEPAHTLECATGSFTMIPYSCPEDSDTFSHGMSAIGMVGDRAVNLEISCMEGVSVDPEQTLTAFLNGFHFAD